MLSLPLCASHQSRHAVCLSACLHAQPCIASTLTCRLLSNIVRTFLSLRFTGQPSGGACAGHVPTARLASRQGRWFRDGGIGCSRCGCSLPAHTHTHTHTHTRADDAESSPTRSSVLRPLRPTRHARVQPPPTESTCIQRPITCLHTHATCLFDVNY